MNYYLATKNTFIISLNHIQTISKKICTCIKSVLLDVSGIKWPGHKPSELTPSISVSHKNIFETLKQFLTVVSGIQLELIA